jgi:toxin-antitoxin system PIN domain toxin
VILPDVNILADAFMEDAVEHKAYADWLDAARADQDLVLPDLVISGLLRIVTNRHIYADPAPMKAAMEFVTVLLATARLLDQSRRTWSTFASITAEDRGIIANTAPDAYLAAVALTHGARVATRDRGFGRFPGLRWFDPAREQA